MVAVEEEVMVTMEVRAGGWRTPSLGSRGRTTPPSASTTSHRPVSPVTDRLAFALFIHISTYISIYLSMIYIYLHLFIPL